MITAFVLTIVCYTLFYGLADTALHIWDEAIYACNALNIAIEGNWMVMKVDGASTLYNTKPPLVIWLQALLIKLLGPGMWSIRLPSALSGLGISIILLLFAKKSLKDIRIGWMAVLVLISSIGFVRYHMTRTGDLDAMLVFWTTAIALLCFHYFLHPSSKEKKIFLAIALATFLGYMTKSTAILLPFAGLAVGSLYDKRIVSIIRSKYFYLFGFVVILLIVGYYFWREQLEAGYWDKVWVTEFQRMTTNIMPWHTKPFSFYFKKLVVDQYFMGYVFLLPLLIYYWIKGAPKEKHMAFVLLAYILSYVLVISYPHTKIGWYLGPLYPIMSLAVGWILVISLERIASLINGSKKSIVSICLVIASFLIIVFPLQKVWDQNAATNPRSPLERYGHAITIIEEENALTAYDVIMLTDRERHKDQARYYVRSLNHYRGRDLRLVDSKEAIDTMRTILICQKEYRKSIEAHFTLKKERDVGGCGLYRFGG